MLTRRSRSPCRQRGLSIVEMLVGVAIGLFVVAASSLVVSTQLVENRRLLIETQVQQDLRAAADIIARELRRAGTGAAATVSKSVWYPGSSGAVNNLLSKVNTPASTEVDYGYVRGAGSGGVLAFGFRLNGTTLQAQLGAGGFQDLTDPKSLKIDSLSIVPTTAPAVQAFIPCPKPCPDGTFNCWPTVAVREFVVTITGEAVSDPAVKRTLQSTVRVRNDWVRYNYPNAVTPTGICPP